MANNPYVNKVVNAETNTTLIDLTSDTAVAADVAQGKYFHLATGERVQGTSTGGGTEAGTVTQDQDGYLVLDDEAGSGGVTVESLSVTQNGTYTAPTGTAYSPVTVNVSGGGGLVYETGTWTPTVDINDYMISFSNSHDSLPISIILTDIGNDVPSANSNTYLTFSNWYGAYGYPMSVSSTAMYYALIRYGFRNASSQTVGGTNVSTLTGDSSSSMMNYWVTTSSFRVNSASTIRYWRSGRTYKWIAVWAPTS